MEKKMENKNEVYKIEENLAKAIVNRHFYYSKHNKESEFSQLSGDLQRAISREAEFQVKTLAQTEGFADILNKDDMAQAQVLHDAICEFYAHKGNLEEKKHPYHPQNLFNVLKERDSKAVARKAFINEERTFDKTSRRAANLNKRIAERKAKGIEHNAALTIQNILDHVKSR